jgi:hypothetical protein
MAFNPDKFDKAEFRARTEQVTVSVLADFFDDGEEPIVTVRGLTSNELHKALNAEKSRKGIEKAIEAISSGSEQVDAMRAVIGLEKGTPGEVAKRLEMLQQGTVEPEFTMAQAVKFAENFPIEFIELTNAISTLTGQGNELVKPPAALLETAS